jgi:uncharacterized membrane protein YciS (DUF1049 family)
MKLPDIMFSAVMMLALVIVGWMPLWWWLQDRGTRQERRIKRLRLQIEEERLKRELLALQGRKSEFAE